MSHGELRAIGGCPANIGLIYSNGDIDGAEPILAPLAHKT